MVHGVITIPIATYNSPLSTLVHSKQTSEHAVFSHITAAHWYHEYVAEWI